MTRIFDGIADTITSVFGDTVTVMPSGGGAKDIRAIFRDGEVPVMTESGAETISAFPTLGVHRTDLAGLIPDGVAAPGNGKTYRCLAKMDGGSPDPRGLVMIQLEEIT